jgi:hypothetical protein
MVDSRFWMCTNPSESKVVREEIESLYKREDQKSREVYLEVTLSEHDDLVIYPVILKNDDKQCTWWSCVRELNYSLISDKPAETSKTSEPSDKIPDTRHEEKSEYLIVTDHSKTTCSPHMNIEDLKLYKTEPNDSPVTSTTSTEYESIVPFHKKLGTLFEVRYESMNDTVADQTTSYSRYKTTFTAFIVRSCDGYKYPINIHPVIERISVVDDIFDDHIYMSTKGDEIAILEWNETTKIMSVNLYLTRQLLDHHAVVMTNDTIHPSITTQPSFIIQPFIIQPFIIQPFIIQPITKYNFSYWPSQSDNSDYDIIWIHGHWIVQDLTISYCYSPSGTHISTFPLPILNNNFIYEGNSFQECKIVVAVTVHGYDLNLPNSELISFWNLSEFLAIMPAIQILLSTKHCQIMDHLVVLLKYHKSTIYITVQKPRSTTYSGRWLNSNDYVISYDINSDSECSLFYVRIPDSKDLLLVPPITGRLASFQDQLIQTTTNCCIYREIRWQFPQNGPITGVTLMDDSYHCSPTFFEIKTLFEHVIDKTDFFKTISILPLTVLMFHYYF